MQAWIGSQCNSYRIGVIVVIGVIITQHGEPVSFKTW